MGHAMVGPLPLPNSDPIHKNLGFIFPRGKLLGYTISLPGRGNKFLDHARPELQTPCR